eukprot:505271-Pleurochrysis_carterae.AAC.1
MFGARAERRRMQRLVLYFAASIRPRLLWRGEKKSSAGGRLRSFRSNSDEELSTPYTTWSMQRHEGRNGKFRKKCPPSTDESSEKRRAAADVRRVKESGKRWPA